MERREIRIVRPLRGAGEVWGDGQPLARVHYDLQEWEQVRLTTTPDGTDRGGADRVIQGSVRQLEGASLLDREDLVLWLADGDQLPIRVVRLARKEYGRPVYTVQHIPQTAGA